MKTACLAARRAVFIFVPESMNFFFTLGKNAGFKLGGISYIE
jgi:hypothetical protein